MCEFNIIHWIIGTFLGVCGGVLLILIVTVFCALINSSQISKEERDRGRV